MQTLVGSSLIQIGQGLEKQENQAPQKLSAALDQFFSEQQYEDKNIKEAKKILGDLSNEFSEEQLKDIVTEVQYLTESWLDNFEREVFKGLTLKELLHEKGAP